MTATLHPIGHIETPYRTLDDCPNNVQQNGPVCTLVLDPDYAAGLRGLSVGQKILLLYWFDKSKRDLLVQHRRGDPAAPLLGTFCLRSPHRPNPIAIAEVPIEAIDGNKVQVRGLDCLTGTKLLDIKPA